MKPHIHVGLIRHQPRWRWGLAAILILIASPMVRAEVPAGSSNDPDPDSGGSVVSDETDDMDMEISYEDEIEDIELLDLEIPVVVTATRREERITKLPYAVSVVTKEEIRRSGARSIPDALRLVPGMDVADLSFGNSAVSPRGLHGFLSDMTLVLVDGRQIFDSLFGGTVWGSWPFQLEDIERIEVIRGPGGVTWGANAVNGVINIITKDPADQLGLTITTGGGSRGSHKEHVGYAFKDGKLRMRVSAEYEGSDGFRKGGSLLRSLDDDYKVGRMSLHAIYDQGPDDTFTFSAGSAVVDGLFAPTPLAGFGVRRNSGSQANYIMGKWMHNISEDNYFELTGYVNDFQASPGVPAIDYRYQQLALQFGHTFKPTQDHTLSWGIDSRVDLLDTSNSDPMLLSDEFISTAIVGLYVQDEWRFAPRWALNLGGRFDYEFFGGFQPSARAALSYELSDDSMVYGAVSRAFQMQAVGLRFLDIPLLNGLARVQSDRDMDPQTLIAYEIGYRGRFFDRLNTSVNLYWNEYDDVTTLSPRLGPPGLITLEDDNRAEASLYGVELDATFAATDQLTLMANYTFQKMNWRASVPFRDKDAISPPDHKAMVGARYDATEDVHLSANLFWVDAVKSPNPSNPFLSQRIDPYFRLDMRGEFEFWEDRASISVGVRNLLDANHYEGGSLFINDAEVPRMVFAELRLNLD